MCVHVCMYVHVCVQKNRRREGGREKGETDRQRQKETHRETLSSFRLMHTLLLTYPHGPIIYIYNLAKVGYGM